MRTTFWVLRFIQCAFCLFCMVIHFFGIINPGEPMQHELFICGIFVGFWFYTFIAVLSYYLGAQLHLLQDAIVNCCGSVCFIIAAFISMGFVENDHHLLYLTDEEEKLHPFFWLNRAQSVASLCTGFLFLTQFLLQADMLFTSGIVWDDISKDPAVLPLGNHVPPNFPRWADFGLDCCTIKARNDRNIDRTV